MPWFPGGRIPCTVIILDEVQQYIGDDTQRSYIVQEVVEAKRADRISCVEKILDENEGEINRLLSGSKIGSRSEDRAILAEDYPLLPVRRRFFETTLRALDKAGTAGQLRTQLRIAYDAIRKTADAPLGTVVAAEFLFDEISSNLLQTGVLLREIDEIIRRQDNGTDNGRLKSRLCAMIFVIRKLPGMRPWT